MYVYEAIGVVMLMIAAVYFFGLTSTQPVAPDIGLTYQLETYGKDALRIVNEKGGFNGAASQIGQKIAEILPPEVQFRVIIDRGGEPGLVNDEYGPTIGSSEITASAHYIFVDQGGDIDNIKLLMWY
jgi:hypothetical protein